MCTGKSAFQAKKENYYREMGLWQAEGRAISNVWNMKSDQYDIDVQENVNAYSRLVGSIQANFGGEVANYMKSKETLFQNNMANQAINEGDKASGFGRSQKLAALYHQATLDTNLRGADRKQTEKYLDARRGLFSANAQALGKRGMPQTRSAEPVKPKGPSFLEQAMGIASTAASFISPIQTLGGAMGVGMSSPMGGFKQRFFQPNRTVGINPSQTSSSPFLTPAYYSIG